jgi:hypothetical protein
MPKKKIGARPPTGLSKSKDRTEVNQVRELFLHAEKLGLAAKDLNEEIESIKDTEAYEINRLGLGSQVKYLHECSGFEAAKTTIQNVAKAKKAEEDTIAAGKKARGET